MWLVASFAEMLRVCLLITTAISASESTIVELLGKIMGLVGPIRAVVALEKRMGSVGISVRQVSLI